MIKIIFFILLFFVSSNCFSQSIVVHEYQDSLIMAEEQNKKILIIFTSDYCSWCKKLKETLSDPTVVENLNNYIICYVNMKDLENKDLIKKHNVKSIPDIFILDKKENIIKHHVGYQNKNQLMNWLRN